MRTYVAGLPFTLDFQDLDAELADTAGYAPPEGAALLAREDGRDAVGFVGVRRVDEHDAELKRLYVDPAVRGTGLGRRLAVAAIDMARAAGYERLLLDTVAALTPAIALYEDLGFVEIAAYRHNPLPDARFFALPLR